jgi:hypothetical protein
MNWHLLLGVLYVFGCLVATEADAQILDAGIGGAHAELSKKDRIKFRSRTGQFIIYPPQSRIGAFAPQPMVQSKPFGQGHLFLIMPQSLIAPTNSRLHLDASLTAVSCERIKEALLNELGEPDSGVRKVHIQLNPRLRERDVVIGAAIYERGWIYSMELPVETHPEFFTASILNVLLLDLVNRQSADKQIEIPKWLVSGLIAHLQSTGLRSLALQSNLQITREQGMDSIAAARQRFQHNVPLTFEELSWPEVLSTNKLALFRDSSHLLVHELLRLKNGRQSLRKFIDEMPRHKNWQFAFLAAFNPEFKTLLEAEKWWALSYIHFTGRDLTKLWSEEQSWKALKAALDTSVTVHLNTNRLPVAAEMNLQGVIQQWDTARHDLAIQKALVQLRSMRMHVHPDYVGLVDDYGHVLENYLMQRTKVGKALGKNDVAVNPTLLKRSACRQLDALDERRSSLRKNLAQNTPN